jgi:hypothetical protein
MTFDYRLYKLQTQGPDFYATLNWGGHIERSWYLAVCMN